MSVIKRASSGLPSCFGVARLVLSVHNNFGDEDGILEDFYGRKGERHVFAATSKFQSIQYFMRNSILYRA